MASSHAAIAQPSGWVARFAQSIPAGEVLDLACGSGRHSRLLAAQGHQVLAVDRDPAALERAGGAGIITLHIDLEADGERPACWPLAPARFSGVVVTNYLHRPLFGELLASLKPGGMLIYETFAQGNERFGKPSNPDFLLRPGELLAIVQSADTQPFRVIAFEDGRIDHPAPAMVQRICAVKPGGDAIAFPLE